MRLQIAVRGFARIVKGAERLYFPWQKYTYFRNLFVA